MPKCGVRLLGIWTYLRMATSQRICQCGAVYERTETHEATVEAGSFDCPVCGHTLEVFSDMSAPRYRLLSRPTRKTSESLK